MLNTYTSSGPHIESKDTIEKAMWNVVVALILPCLAAIMLFGLYSLYLIVATALACVIFEIPFDRGRFTKRRPFGDGSAVMTGMLLGLTFAPTSSWWMPILGGFLAIVIGKQVFGGLGNNIFNPALVARGILLLSWPLNASQWIIPFDGVTSATPLAGSAASYWELFIGTVPGSIGETSAVALILGALYLYVKGYIEWRIPLSYVASSAFLAILLGVDPIFTILSGGLLLGALFMATDMVTSPVTKNGRLIYGIGCGLLTVLIREFTIFPEGVTFAILLMNGSSHFIDTITEGPRFGQVDRGKRQIVQVATVGAAVALVGVFLYGVTMLSDTLYPLRAEVVTQKLVSQYFSEVDEIKTEEHGDAVLVRIFADDNESGYALYTSSSGYNAPITKFVAFDNELTLLGITVVDHREDVSLGARVTGDAFLSQFQGIPVTQRDEVLNNLSAITGATVSSMGIARGVEQAIDTLARVLDWEHEEEAPINIEDLPEGKYTGVAMGFRDDMEVEVSIEEGRIVDIEVVDHSDTPRVADPAFESLIDEILGSQNLDVDAVTGATASSEGLLEAIRNALTGDEVEGEDQQEVDADSSATS